ncbi:MAG: type II secretion system protein [Xanthomonadales bacterium]|nr:type II secretion system protein [Xanthomonadales bacterium]
MIRCRPSCRGFTLLEVLLAFVVFALSFAVVLEILSGSIRATTRARSYTEAALFAQSLMDMVGTDIPLVEGSVGGDAPGGYRWQIDISSYQPQDADDRSLEIAEVTGTVLYWVDLDLAWGETPRERHARFTTVRSQLADFQP